MNQTTEKLRLPPHDIEAEQVILSAMLLNPGIISKVGKKLEADDFYREGNGIVFASLVELGAGADAVTLADNIKQKGKIELIGGTEYLFDLEGAVATSAAWEHHAKILKGLSTRRKIIAQCQATMETCFKPHIDTDEILQGTRKAFNQIDILDPFTYRAGVDIANVYDAEKCLNAYRESIQDLKKNRFITGIHEIDRRIRGVSGGEILFILARAGSFKTALLQNLLKNYVNNSSWASVFFSIEMPISSLAERYHEIISGTSGKDIETAYRSDMDGASAHREALEEDFKTGLKSLFIVDARVSLRDVVSYVRLIEREKRVKVGLVGIDYLGLMEGQGRGEYEIMSALARDCKNTAKLLNLPMVILSQTSRKGGTGFTEIEMDMARGSGAIEEAADFILGLYQWPKDQTSVESAFSEDIQYDLICKILKNRKGSKGSRFRLDLDPENLRIGPDAEPWEPPTGNGTRPRGFDG